MTYIAPVTATVALRAGEVYRLTLVAANPGALLMAGAVRETWEKTASTLLAYPITPLPASARDSWIYISEPAMTYDVKITNAGNAAPASELVRKVNALHYAVKVGRLQRITQQEAFSTTAPVSRDQASAQAGAGNTFGGAVSAPITTAARGVADAAGSVLTGVKHTVWLAILVAGLALYAAHKK